MGLQTSKIIFTGIADIITKFLPPTILLSRSNICWTLPPRIWVWGRRVRAFFRMRLKSRRRALWFSGSGENLSSSVHPTTSCRLRLPSLARISRICHDKKQNQYLTHLPQQKSKSIYCTVSSKEFHMKLEH